MITALSSSTWDTSSNTINLAKLLSVLLSTLYYPLVVIIFFFFSNNLNSKINTIFTLWIHCFFKYFLLYHCSVAGEFFLSKCTVLQPLTGNYVTVLHNSIFCPKNRLTLASHYTVIIFRFHCWYFLDYFRLISAQQQTCQ